MKNDKLLDVFLAKIQTHNIVNIIDKNTRYCIITLEPTERNLSETERKII